MSTLSNHQLANLRQRELKLRARRREILRMDPENALDEILDAPSPATLTQSFPDEDLYFLMHRIGPSDFLPVLSLASSDQWEYILDVEAWNDDRMDTRIMTRAFDLLFGADPERFLRWIITQKPGYFEFYLYKNMEIVIREHDEPPPSDHDDYVTVDDKFYLRFPDKAESGDEPVPAPDADPDAPKDTEAGELVETMLKKLASMDLSVYHGLLLETVSVLPAETEEEEFRQKNIRLAEKGFLPTHEAIGIYQPTPLENLRKRPKTAVTGPDDFDPEIPLPPQCFSGFLEGEALFVQAVSCLPRDFLITLESEIAALVNKIISADRIKVREKETMGKVMEKAVAFLSLGLEIILQGRPTREQAGDIIRDYYLEDIFRTGSRAGIMLKSRAEAWYNESFIRETSLPLSFLGEHFLGVIGGLFLDRPLCYDNYASGDLYRNFNILADIQGTQDDLDRIMALDRFLSLIDPDITSFQRGVLTHKSLILTLWAKDRLGLDTDLAPIESDRFRPFFTDLFTGEEAGKIDALKGQDLVLWAADVSGLEADELPQPLLDLLADMVSEIGEEYGHVAPAEMDPRFIPHFLLK